MGWESAKKGVVMEAGTSHGGAGAWNPHRIEMTAKTQERLAYHRERMNKAREERRREREKEEEGQTTDDEFATTEYYGSALQALANEDKRYLKNWNIYKGWTTLQRLYWITVIEQQAIDDLDTIGAILVRRVVVMRLEG